MDPSIDRQVALEVVSVLREEGLTRGRCRVVDRAAVELPLEVQQGLEPAEFCAAIRAQRPHMPERVAEAITGNVCRDADGTLKVKLSFRLRLAAIHCQHFANTGQQYGALV
jgi:hypothetical protein